MEKETLIKEFKAADAKVRELEKTDLNILDYGVVEKSERLIEADNKAQELFNKCIDNNIDPFN